jgi:purine-binding chemotaxis protein CheW
MKSSRQMTTFCIDRRWFGIDVMQVQEVLPWQQMTRVPLAAPSIKGLINLRGEIVTAIDLRQRLGFPAASMDRPPMNVVVNLPGGLLSLLVDEVGEVLQVAEEDFETPPATLQGPLRDLTAGAYKIPGCLLVTLDTNKLANIEEL